MKRLILLLGLAACALGQAESTPTSGLVVDNQYKTPIHVYVDHNGSRVRSLGVVESYTKTTFLLHSGDLYGGRLQLFLLSFLDGNAMVTDQVTMAEGQTAHLDIGPLRGSQFLYLRNAP